VKRILIGNKADMVNERVIETSRGQALADEYGIKFFECSAKTEQNVSEAFMEIARQSMADVDVGKGDNVTPGDGGNGQKKCC
jgi:Ras-related protein Rab-8A